MDLQEELNKAESALKEERFDDALKTLSNLIERYPDDARLYSERGVIYFHKKDREKSLSDMDKAVDLEKDNSYRYSSRAYVKASFKMTDEAIEDYKKCIELDPDDAIAHNNLGLLLEQKGWQNQAEESFHKADTLEGILKERNIDLPEEETENIELSEEEEEVTFGDKVRLIKKVFTDKNTFKEFIDFVKNGFKIDE